MVRLRALGVAALLALTACSGGGSGASTGPTVPLDGSPRVADDAGVVTEVTTERIVLDGRRRYRLSRSLQSFSTYNGATTPVRQWIGHYVHVGADGDVAGWVAGIGVVVDGEPAAVYYSGRLEDVDGEQLVFLDGTVLRGADALDPAAVLGVEVQATIDPDGDAVVELVPL